MYMDACSFVCLESLANLHQSQQNKQTKLNIAKNVAIKGRAKTKQYKNKTSPYLCYKKL